MGRQASPAPLCDGCGTRRAVIFISQNTENAKQESGFCEVCARQKAAGAAEILSHHFRDESISLLSASPEGGETTDAFGADPESLEAVQALSPSNERCPRCLTTWDTVRRDGRAGCPDCYIAFRDALEPVMSRVQRSGEHTGKVPRAAQKRDRREENLRKRRENQLELLRNRLQLALADKKFAEAALLRDKIKALD